MKLYLVTPPEDEGGRDMECIVAAGTPNRAVRLVQDMLDGRPGEHVRLNDHTRTDVWVARELPALSSIEKVLDWSHSLLTFWEALP